MKKIFILGFLAAVWANGVLADQEEINKTITDVAAQGASGGYFRVSETLTSPCGNGVIYFSGSNYLSILLSAKLAGRKLSRMVLSRDANNLCTVTLAQME